MSNARILDELSAAEHALATASEQILTLTEAALALPHDAAMGETLNGVLEACAFGDLVGQRLARIARLVQQRADTRPDAAIMNGPGDDALAQKQADALMRADLPGFTPRT